MLLYIHGFNSSAASHKSTQLRTWMERNAPAHRFCAPSLSHWPDLAMATLGPMVESALPDVTLIGSSLGGFYATWLAERHGVRAILVNPALRPHEGLAAYLGPQQNLHTGERYELTPLHLRQLADLRVAAPDPSRYLLMVTTGDELLDYRLALTRYRGARTVVVGGSDHGFGDFDRHMAPALAFAGIAGTGHPGRSR